LALDGTSFQGASDGAATLTLNSSNNFSAISASNSSGSVSFSTANGDTLQAGFDGNATTPFTRNLVTGVVSYKGGTVSSPIHIGEGDSAEIVVGANPDENTKIAELLTTMHSLKDAMQSGSNKASAVINLRDELATRYPDYDFKI
jgi:hypothetical protein